MLRRDTVHDTTTCVLLCVNERARKEGATTYASGDGSGSNYNTLRGLESLESSKTLYTLSNRSLETSLYSPLRTINWGYYILGVCVYMWSKERATSLEELKTMIIFPDWSISTKHKQMIICTSFQIQIRTLLNLLTTWIFRDVFVWCSFVRVRERDLADSILIDYFNNLFIRQRACVYVCMNVAYNNYHIYR